MIEEYNKQEVTAQLPDELKPYWDLSNLNNSETIRNQLYAYFEEVKQASEQAVSSKRVIWPTAAKFSNIDPTEFRELHSNIAETAIEYLESLISEVKLEQENLLYTYFCLGTWHDIVSGAVIKQFDMASEVWLKSRVVSHLKALIKFWAAINHEQKQQSSPRLKAGEKHLSKQYWDDLFKSLQLCNIQKQFCFYPSEKGYISANTLLVANLFNKPIISFPRTLTHSIHAGQLQLRFLRLWHEIEHGLMFNQAISTLTHLSPNKVRDELLFMHKTCVADNRQDLRLFLFIFLHEMTDIYFNPTINNHTSTISACRCFLRALERIIPVPQNKESYQKSSIVEVNFQHLTFANDIKYELRAIGIDIPKLKKEGDHVRNNRFIQLAIISLLLKFCQCFKADYPWLNKLISDPQYSLRAHINKLNSGCTEQNGYTPKLKEIWGQWYNDTIRLLDSAQLPYFSYGMSFYAPINTENTKPPEPTRLNLFHPRNTA